MAEDVVKDLHIDLQSVLNKELNEPLQKADRYFNQLTTLQSHLNKLTEEYNELKKHGSDVAKADLKQHKEAIKELEKAIKLKKQYDASSPLKAFAKSALNLKDKQTGADLASEVGSKLRNAFTSGANILKSTLNLSWMTLQQVLTNAIGEMKNMLQSSLLTNAKTRENVFTYGMSASESYGFEKAKDLLNISSDSDLMYMNSQQSQLFRESMKKYADKYAELYDKGYFEEMLQFQVEMDMFKQDVELALVRMFLDNKDTIISGFHALLTIAEKMTAILDWMGARQSATASDVLNNYSTKSISVDTTFNITGQISKEDATNIGTQMGDYWDSYVKNQ